MKKALVLTALTLGVSALVAVAQDGPPPGGQQRRVCAQQGDDAERPRRPVPPLIAALDANHDGVIDEQEIANASVVLKTLDKNNDGKLTHEELIPPRPEGQGARSGQVSRRGGPQGGWPPGRPPGDDEGERPPGPPPEE